MQKMVEKLRLCIAAIVIIPFRGSKFLHCCACPDPVVYIKAVAVLHQVVHNVNAEQHMLLFPLVRSDGFKKLCRIDLDRVKP